jgi:hypothetical protein
MTSQRYASFTHDSRGDLIPQRVRRSFRRRCDANATSAVIDLHESLVVGGIIVWQPADTEMGLKEGP